MQTFQGDPNVDYTHMHDAGFKVLAINPSSDSAGNDPMQALEFFLKKINERPER